MTITTFVKLPDAQLKEWLGMKEPSFRTFGISETDFQVLERIRTFLFDERGQFQRNLREILQGRCPVADACFEDLLVMYYKPGDYAEAARFLWDNPAGPTSIPERR